MPPGSPAGTMKLRPMRKLKLAIPRLFFELILQHQTRPLRIQEGPVLSTLLATSLLFLQPGPNSALTITIPGRAPIDQALVSPDGRRLFLATQAGAEAFDLDTGKLLFNGAYGRQIEISPKGDLLAVLQINIGMISVGGTISVLDAASGKLLHQSPGTAAAFSPDSRWLISSSSYGVGRPKFDEPPKGQITDLRTGKMHLAQFHVPVGTNPGWGRIVAGPSSFTKDGKFLVARNRSAAGKHQITAACELETGKPLEQLPKDADIVPERSPHYSEGDKRYVRDWTVFDVEKDKALCKLVIPEQLRDHSWYGTFHISPDGRWVYSASSSPRSVKDDEMAGTRTMKLASHLHVFDAETGQWKQAIATAKVIKSLPLLTTKKLNSFPISEPHFVVDLKGERAIAYSDQAVQVWDLNLGKLVRTFRDTGHATRPEILRFSPDSKWLASASTYGEVMLWNAQTGAPGRPIDRVAALGDISFRPKSMELIGVGHGAIHAWDATTGELKRTFEHKANFFLCPSHPNGKLAALGDHWSSTLTLLDVDSGKDVLRLRGGAKSLAFSPKGDTLLAVDTHGNATIWDTATGKKLHEWPSGKSTDYRYAIRRAAWLPDGKRFLLCESDAVAIVNAATGKREREFSLKAKAGHQTHDADVHPDGERFVVAYYGQQDIEERDLKNGNLLRTYPGYAYGAAQARYSPDGARLATVGPYSFEMRIHAVAK